MKKLVLMAVAAKACTDFFLCLYLIILASRTLFSV